MFRIELRGMWKHAHRAENCGPTISSTKQNQIEEIFKSSPKRYFEILDSLLESILQLFEIFLREKLKVFHISSLLHLVQHLSDAKKKNRAAQLAHSCMKKLQKNSNFLKRLVFSHECIFSLLEAVKKQICRIWVSEQLETIYESLQGSKYCKKIFRPQTFKQMDGVGRSIFVAFSII